MNDLLTKVIQTNEGNLNQFLKFPISSEQQI